MQYTIPPKNVWINDEIQRHIIQTDDYSHKTGNPECHDIDTRVEQSKNCQIKWGHHAKSQACLIGEK